MNLQSLISYVPFLALLYALFAFGQILRHKQQGLMAALLALVSVAAPLIAYILITDVTVRATLIQYMAINAAVIFVVSLLILLIKRRNTKRDRSRSYGMLGLGLSLLLAVGIFALPLLSPSASNMSAAVSIPNNGSNTSGIVLVSGEIPNASNNRSSSGAEATASAEANTTTEVATALTAQTGLSADDLLSQIQSGSTIADLIKSHNGTDEPVVTAISQALDALIKAGGQQAQMISSLGSDTMQMATQLVQGTLGQVQQFLLPQLITGKMPTPPNGQAGGPNGTPPADGNGSSMPNGQSPVAESTESVSNNPVSAQQAIPTNTPQATPTATTTVVRPTQIFFPTATATVSATATSEASGTATTTSTGSSSAATCNLVVDYNLNLRDQPATEGSKIYLSIPFGTTITATGRTTDGWYKVAYNGQEGWVNDAYVTAANTCSSLTTISGS